MLNVGQKLQWSGPRTVSVNVLIVRVGQEGCEGVGGGVVEYQNTRNKASNVPKIILKLV